MKSGSNVPGKPQPPAPGASTSGQENNCWQWLNSYCSTRITGNKLASKLSQAHRANVKFGLQLLNGLPLPSFVFQIIEFSILPISICNANTKFMFNAKESSLAYGLHY
jgi:hypothetical protein